MMEILIVMSIIAVLAALSMGGLMFAKEKQRNSKAEIQVKLLSKAIQDYQLDNGDFPGEENAGDNDGTGESNTLFQALYWDSDDDGDGMDEDSPDEDQTVYLSDLDPANDSQQWIEGAGSSATIIDPWKNEFRYRRGNNAINPDFDIWSAGKDGESQGDASDDTDKDDITNY